MDPEDSRSDSISPRWGCSPGAQMKPWIDTNLLDDDPIVRLAALGAGCFSWLKPPVLQEDRVPSFLLLSGPAYAQLLPGAPRGGFCSKDCLSRPGTTHFPLSHLCLLCWPRHHSFWGAYFDLSFSPHRPPSPASINGDNKGLALVN